MDDEQFFRTELLHMDGSVTIALVGELDVSQARYLDLPAIAARYDRAQVTFDCSRLTFMDLGGLDALLREVRRFSGPGKPRLLAARGFVRLLLDTTGATDQFELEDQVLPTYGEA